MLFILVIGKSLLELSNLSLSCVIVVMAAMKFAPPLIGWLVQVYNQLCEKVLARMEQRRARKAPKKAS